MNEGNLHLAQAMAGMDLDEKLKDTPKKTVIGRVHEKLQTFRSGAGYHSTTGIAREEGRSAILQRIHLMDKNYGGLRGL
uniref:Uncharacterized protein n=1 Tax=Timema cristinae TaxID=61476 RepID=A0A7R9GSN5_TIMCR|nr:unnamed protein product [Timema cristinae]